MSRDRVQIAWSISGYLVPAVASLFLLPITVRGLGEARYGLFALAMTTLGFLALLDLGLGAAGLRELAVARSQGDAQSSRRVFWTLVTFYTAVGSVAGSFVWAAAPWLVRHAFTVPAGLDGTAESALRAAAVGLVLNLWLPPWFAALRVAERLDVQNRIGIVSSIAASGLAAWRGAAGDLAGVLISQVAVSAATLLATMLAARRADPLHTGWERPQGHVLRGMAAFAGWQLAGQVSASIGAYAGRFVLASRFGPGDLTVYHVPYTLGQRIQRVLEAATRLLLPRVASLVASGNRDSAAAACRRALKWTLLFGFSLCVPLAVLAEPVLNAWMGADFGARATPALRIVALGFAAGAPGVVYSAVLLGAGRAREVFWMESGLTAVNVVLLWPLSVAFGVTGVALSFLLGWSALVIGAVAVRAEFGPAASRGAVRTALGAAATAACASLLLLPAAHWAGRVGVLGPLAVLGAATAMTLAAAATWPALFGEDRDLAHELRDLARSALSTLRRRLGGSRAAP